MAEAVATAAVVLMVVDCYNGDDIGGRLLTVTVI